LRGELIFAGKVNHCNDQLALRIISEYHKTAERAIIIETGNIPLSKSFNVSWERDPESKTRDVYLFSVRVFTKILIYLEKGTKPHQLRVQSGKAVPMRIGGKLVFRKVTSQDIAKGKWEHPGTAPKNMFLNAWNSTIGQFLEVGDETQYDK